MKLPLAKIVLISVLVCAANAQTSLLVNGTFEEGPSPRAYLNLANGSKVLPGWVVTGEGVDYVEGYFVASDGRRSIDLDGSRRSTITPPYVHGGIAQTFATKPGARYNVTFDLGGNVVAPPAIKLMRISAAGQQKEYQFDITGKTRTNVGWRKETWSFTANAETTTLEFVSLTVSPGTGWGAAIDNVAVARK